MSIDDLGTITGIDLCLAKRFLNIPACCERIRTGLQDHHNRIAEANLVECLACDGYRENCSRRTGYESHDYGS